MGNVGKITALGSSSVNVMFNDMKRIVLLKNCFYMPKFDVNIVSLARLDTKDVK